MPAEQEFGLRDYLTLFGKELTQRVRIHHYEDLPRQTRFERGTYILSAIDQLHPGTVRLVEELRCRLAELDGTRVLNHPLRTLSRYELLEKLWGLGRNRFRAVHAAQDIRGLRYPVFLRRDRTHEGAITDLLYTPKQLDTALGHALLGGHPFHDLLVVEFCNTADERGYFRKYGSFVVGKEVMARSLELGPHWMLKDETSDFSRDMLLEEQEYVRSNTHRHELAKIFAIAGVEYGRIDYSVSDGAIQTWEINTNPTVGLRIGFDLSGRPPELAAMRDLNREHFGARFRAAMAAVDVESTGPPMELAFDSRIIRTALGENRRRAISSAGLRAVLRPFKPLLAPAGVRVLGLLARLIRRARRYARLAPPLRSPPPPEHPRRGNQRGPRLPGRWFRRRA